MITCSLLAFAAAALLTYTVYAHCGTCAADGRKIAAQLDQSKTNLAKAVAAAEAHSKGRAISVISDLHESGVAVHVYCITGEPSAAPKIMKCSFDHATGSIKGMKEVHEFPVTPKPAHDAQHEHGDGHSMKSLNKEVAEVACGACIYKMSGVQGCPLAINIDGKHYLVEGATWPNHDYCDRTCTAIVTGKLLGNPPKFICTSLTEKK